MFPFERGRAFCHFLRPHECQVSLLEELACLVSSLLLKSDKQPARSANVDGKHDKLDYDVVVDAVGLNWEQAGPLFERYAVSLAGRVDRIWVDCYKRLIAE